MKIVTDQKNEFLNRRELVVSVDATQTPSFVEMQKMLSDDLKASSDLVVVKSINSGFGNSTFNIEAYVYQSANDKTKFEPKVKVKKGAAGGAK